jgi:hypothetical protein
LLDYKPFDFSKATFKEIFEYIKSIPYRADPVGVEHVSRPKFTLNNVAIAFDCDDRSVIIRSAVILKNYLLTGNANPDYPIKSNIVVSGRASRPHHVYMIVTIPDLAKDFPIDPTYPKNEYGKVLFPEKFRKIY